VRSSKLRAIQAQRQQRDTFQRLELQNSELSLGCFG
jgi:hypothetical protein